MLVFINTAPADVNRQACSFERLISCQDVITMAIVNAYMRNNGLDNIRINETIKNVFRCRIFGISPEVYILAGGYNFNPHLDIFKTVKIAASVDP